MSSASAFILIGDIYTPKKSTGKSQFALARIIIIRECSAGCQPRHSVKMSIAMGVYPAPYPAQLLRFFLTKESLQPDYLSPAYRSARYLRPCYLYRIPVSKNFQIYLPTNLYPAPPASGKHLRTE